MPWWQCASRILCHHANAARRIPQLSSTLGPERLPIHHGFAQHCQTNDFGCNSCCSQRCGQDVQVRCYSHAPREAPHEYEWLACSDHVIRRSMPTPRSAPTHPRPSTKRRQRPNDLDRAPSPTSARQFAESGRSSVVGWAAPNPAATVHENRNTRSQPRDASVEYKSTHAKSLARSTPYGA